jgi:ribose transport system permease protein
MSAVTRMSLARTPSAISVLLLIGTFVAIGIIQPDALTYDGLSLILVGAMPVILATMAQLFIMAAGDIDLGIGQFVGLVNVIAAASLGAQPGLAILGLALAAVAYVLMGALITYRGIPSIVVTFGMGSIWLGISLLIMPTPGGEAPVWLSAAANAEPPLVPLPIIVFVVLTVVVYLLLNRTRLGIRLRAAGASPEAAMRVGLSVIRLKMTLYGLAALMGLLAGLILTGSTGSGDANSAATLVLSTVAAVIVGGGEFRGGRVDAVGAACAAVAIGLITSIMAFLNVSAAYTSAVEGLILVVALGVRVVAFRRIRPRSRALAAL